MMKKNILFLLPTLLLAACSSPSLPQVEKTLKASDPSTILEGMATLLSHPLQMDATLTTVDGSTLQIQDQISSDVRTTTVFSGSAVESQRTFLRDSQGDADELYLNMQNEIETIALDEGDQDQTPIDYDETYGSPFQMIDADNIGTFFTVESAQEGYQILPTPKGKSVLATSLDSFYPFQENEVWDSVSVRSYAENIRFAADGNGTLTSLSFDHVKEDDYGGMAEHYEVEVSAIDSVTRLSPVTSTLTAEQETALANVFTTLGSQLATGNFTQSVTMTQAATSYQNYYDLPYTGNVEDGLGLMLSSAALSDGSNSVYTGLGYGYRGAEETGDLEFGYWAIGVTPATEQFGMVSNEFSTSIEAAVPTLGSFSTDFFSTTDGVTYEFRPSSLPFYNREFAIEIMTGLLGVGDYLSHTSSQYYLDDLTAMSFDFERVRINIADASNPVFTLYYRDPNGQLCTTQTRFSDFGTTDLQTLGGDLATAVDIAILNLFGTEGENA